MASYQHLLQHSNPRLESPAKVFAKLKYKVQREEVCAREGISSCSEALCNVKINHGGEFRSPMKPTESARIIGDFRERTGFGSRDEAKALTISPVSSPQKSLGFWNSYSTLTVDEPLVSGRGHGCTPRKEAFLESTAVGQPQFLVSRKRNHVETAWFRDVDRFDASNKTHMRAVENDHVLRQDQTFEKSTSSVVSPMRNRLRKRKMEPWDFSNVSSSTKIHNDTRNQPQENKTCVDGSRESCVVMENLVHRPGFSAVRPGISRFPWAPVIPPSRSMGIKHCSVLLETCPLLSPAKMFAFMKKRESRAVHQDVHQARNTMRALFTGSEFHNSCDAPQPAVAETADTDTVSDGESTVLVCQSSADTAESQSTMGPSEAVPIPAEPSQPVLIEDPLIINSPRISIPKKNKTTFKPSCPQPSKIPPESVIHLKKWFLRHNQKGLFVEGIHREENIAWNSNIIAERISQYVVKTVTGRVYILIGKMDLHVDSDFPRWFLKKFLSGFPLIWKEVYEKFLSESRIKDTERKSDERNIRAKRKASVNLSVKSQRINVFKTPDTIPPSSSSSSSTLFSRSGRVIKPPLEYWKGGRVTLDAHMNVTIHDCYNTSICNPEDTAAVSAQDKAPSAPWRNVKAPSRRRNKVKGECGKKPSHSPDSTVESFSNSEESTSRQTRYSQRGQHMNAVPHWDTEISSMLNARKLKSETKNVRVLKRNQAVPASRLSPDINDASSEQSSQGSLKVRRTKQPSRLQKKRADVSPQLHHSEKGRKEVTKRGRVKKMRVSERNQAVPASRLSPDINDTSSEQSPQGSLNVRRTKQPSRLQKKRADVSPQLHHYRKEVRRTGMVEQNQEKNKNISERTNKSSTSSKRPKMHKGNVKIPPEQDEDKWTEEELAKLQEAVALFPKHMANYWAEVARIVGTHSAEECHNQHTCQGTSQSPVTKATKGKKKQPDAPKGSENPLISAGVGTFKRKQQVRHFLETMPKDNMDDVFSCSYMQNKRFEIPAAFASNLSDEHDITLRDLEPVTPRSAGFPEVKTPQCLSITPGMMGSPNRSNDDKYVFQLQKRMKKSQFNVHKQAPSKKTFTPTPSVKRTMRRCGDADTFVVWEMFPGKEQVLSDSGEEEDYYFSDNDCT